MQFSTFKKRILIIFLLFVFSVGFFSAVSAAEPESGYQLLAPIPTITDASGAAKTVGVTLVEYMKGIFTAAIGLAIIMAVVQLVIGGVEYVAAALPSTKEDAKKRITGAVGGLLLILVSYIILDTLNPGLLSVGLNLEQVAVPEDVVGVTVDGVTYGKNSICSTDSSCSTDCYTGQTGSAATTAEIDCQQQEAIRRVTQEDCSSTNPLSAGQKCISKTCDATASVIPKGCGPKKLCGIEPISGNTHPSNPFATEDACTAATVDTKYVCEVCTLDVSGGTGSCKSATSDPKRINVGDATGKCKQYFDMVDASVEAINAPLVKAIIATESGCSQGAQSGSGACGIMQMLPSTAKNFASDCAAPANPTCDYLKNNPREAICMGSRNIIKELVGLGIFNAIAGYNAGYGPKSMGLSQDCATLDSCGGPQKMRRWECPWSDTAHTVPDTGYAETRNYVPIVLYYINLFK